MYTLFSERDVFKKSPNLEVMLKTQTKGKRYLFATFWYFLSKLLNRLFQDIFQQLQRLFNVRIWLAQLCFFGCRITWVQNLRSDGWSSFEQGYSIAIQMHPDHKKYWLKEMFPAFYVHLIENLVGKPQRQLVRSFSSMKISPSIFRPVLSRGETVDSCCSQCSDDVRWCQLLMWNASHRPRTRKQEDHCLSLFSTNQNFHKALTILFTNKQTCLVNLYYLYINPTFHWLDFLVLKFSNLFRKSNV